MISDPSPRRRVRDATLYPRIITLLIAVIWLALLACRQASAGAFFAGAAKIDITNEEAGPVDGRLHVRALVLRHDKTMVVLLTLDVVAIGEIGYVKNDYLPKVRQQLRELGISPSSVIVNASHCHGIPCKDVDAKSIAAVQAAMARLEPVTVGVGVGHEDRIMENRRFKLKDGRTVDVRHAYSMPPDEEVAEVGPVDPEIGVLRLDRADGSTLAVVYNFACHPIQGVPSGANTADITGFSSEVIEDNLGDGAVALFVQGCGGDINPIAYKEVDQPRDAEPLGNTLGLSTLTAVRDIECREDDRLKVFNETITLPRGDRTERIAQLESRQRQLLQSLGGTSLNFETFLPLYVKYSVSGEYPSSFSHRYLHEDALGRDDLRKIDSNNRRDMDAYINNIHTMEELTRLQTNLRLLQKHQKNLVASGKRTIDVEMVGLRVGDFVLVTSPGELTVPIGLGIKKRSPHEHTFVAGYTNGYIYYAPTAEQLLNLGGAQEDSDCLLSPEWQEVFESKVTELLRGL
ncbi:MAG: hypothetical protein KDA93_26930 [Planctomycetaceae bacterium]|nr:hypothetical protein [Planctomycetaceae bacterium]